MSVHPADEAAAVAEACKRLRDTLRLLQPITATIDLNKPTDENTKGRGK